MSATVDSHLLVHATDESSPLHAPALSLLAQLSDGPHTLSIFWPVVLGYVRLVTDPGLFGRPLAENQAIENIGILLDRPSVVAVGFEDGFWDAFPRAASEVYMRADRVAHGYLVALMREHGVPTIWSRDRKFRHFQGITVKDPFAHRPITPHAPRSR